MGFTIPNAAAATTIDQSEPDSVDFQALGNRQSGVISGCVVTVSATTQSVDIAAGEVFTDGTYRSVSAATVSVGQGDASSPRFDLIVVNASGTIVCRAGTAGTNPTFPALTAGDVTLAAVYRGSGTGDAIDANRIIDKRVFIMRSSTIYTGSGTPSGAVGNVGDVYINTTAYTNSNQTQAWIKTGASTWENVAKPNITIATTAPTGGSNGDVWIQVV